MSFRLSWISLVLLAAFAVPASAQCKGQGTVCAEFDASPLVFYGRVTQASPSPEEQPLGPLLPQVVNFEVLEDFKGTAGGAASLTFDAAMPGQRFFTPGETVLVYARQTPDRSSWFAGCSRTRRVPPEDPELTTLRQLRSQVRGGSVEGTLEVAPARRPPAVPLGVDLGNLPIVIQAIDGTETVSITTQAGGYYLIPWLRPGRYRLRFDAPAFEAVLRDIVVAETGRCQTIDPIIVRPR
jgi:hypothetical protein